MVINYRLLIITFIKSQISSHKQVIEIDCVIVIVIIENILLKQLQCSVPNHFRCRNSSADCDSCNYVTFLHLFQV